MSFIMDFENRMKPIKRSNAQHKSLEQKAIKQNNQKKALYHKAVRVNQWTDKKIMTKKEKQNLFSRAMKGYKKLW
jgi:hypothetical protein